MIKCKNVTKKFYNKIILNNFNYTFKDNTITAIMGKSGKGKTTLIRCIAGLEKIDSGNIVYCHNNIQEKIIRPNKDIFMMHQHYGNFPWLNCLDNVLFPLKQHNDLNKQSKEEAKQLLIEVGLSNCEDKYPKELSGGMNQRLACARTLIMKPQVLLMDEPTSALDEDTRNGIQKLLIDMHKKTKNIIILVTHNQLEADSIADDIINI